MEKIKNIIISLFKFIGVLLVVLTVLAVIYCGIDFVLKDVLPHISRAVLSNFVVFALVIAIVLKSQVHPVKLVEDAQKTVVDSINESETVKNKAAERLSSIQSSVENLESEITGILNKSDENARLVGEKILEDANKTALVVQENTGKAIENSRMILKNDLIRRASLASVEVARNHIVNELSWNQGLHDKLIDESIEALSQLSKDANEGGISE